MNDSQKYTAYRGKFDEQLYENFWKIRKITREIEIIILIFKVIVNRYIDFT